MHCLVVPEVSVDASWPEAVKADFTSQLHKFMANLTETVHEVQSNARKN
jgi:dynein heavy chain, axonemal